jgi:hypothetical protein
VSVSGKYKKLESLAKSSTSWETTESTDINHYYPLASEVAKGYSNATVRPSVTSLWPL